MLLPHPHRRRQSDLIAGFDSQTHDTEDTLAISALAILGQSDISGKFLGCLYQFPAGRA